MAASAFTLRFSGNVALTNGGVRSFMGVYDGNVRGSLTGSVTACSDVLTAFPTVFTAFFAAISPTTVTGFTDSSSTDAVDSFTLHMSGQIANDDNTVSLFDWETNEGGVIINHVPGTIGADALNEVAQVEALREIVELVLEDMVTPTDVTVSAT